MHGAIILGVEPPNHIGPPHSRGTRKPPLFRLDLVVGSGSSAHRSPMFLIIRSTLIGAPMIASCDQLDWLLLTKRPQNIRKMLPTDWGNGYANVWLGTTAEDAEAYRQRVKHLLVLPAVAKFVSYEPALGALGPINIDGRKPDWIIIGGESGVRADLTRPTRPEWVRDVITQCQEENVAPFLKQWGTYTNNPLVAEQGCSVEMAMRKDPPQNGKGGGKLDGKIWRAFPSPQIGASLKGRQSNNADQRRALLVG